MPADRNDPNRELYSIAFVTVDESTFPEMRRALADNFKLGIFHESFDLLLC